MAREMKTVPKKFAFSSNAGKTKNTDTYSKNKAAERRNILRHLIHPEYILFDWEFFSNQLEFE